MSQHSFENKLRYPAEGLVALVSLTSGMACFYQPVLFGLTGNSVVWASLFFIGLGLKRGVSWWALMRYQNRLKQVKPYKMSTQEVPLSTKRWFIGLGFEWDVIHRQRLSFFELDEYAHYLKPNRLNQYVQRKVESETAQVWEQLQRLPYLRPLPELGGKPQLHGVGVAEEKPIFIHHTERHGHTLVLGTTRVGKTRLLSILVNQDIRNGEAVLVVDPKGDLELMQDIYAAAKSCGRLHEFKVIHAGVPEWSAKYNPLKNFTDIAEVTGRVTAGIDASGEGQQFKDFAWKFLNTTAICLSRMHRPINYKSLSYFVHRPEILLAVFAEQQVSQWYTDHEQKIQEIIALHTTVDKKGREKRPSRKAAIFHLVETRKEALTQAGDIETLNREPIFDLIETANTSQDYYKKITASLGPVLDKINKTQAADIFSWKTLDGLTEVNLETAVKRKQIIYMGLDSLTNAAMSGAIGKAIIADLISMFGRFQRDGIQRKRVLNCYFDEFSEILPPEFSLLVNKAGGSGARVTAFGQTINDIEEACGSAATAQKIIGNFATLITLRVKNLETARVFTEPLQKVRVRSAIPSSIVQDKPQEDKDDLYTTTNSDSVAESKEFIVNENDIISLPKGQAFVSAEGGKIYKIRIPLPKFEGHPPETLEDIMAEVNQL